MFDKVVSVVLCSAHVRQTEIDGMLVRHAAMNGALSVE